MVSGLLGEVSIESVISKPSAIIMRKRYMHLESNCIRGHLENVWS